MGVPGGLDGCPPHCGSGGGKVVDADGDRGVG